MLSKDARRFFMGIVRKVLHPPVIAIVSLIVMQVFDFSNQAIASFLAD